jgi:arylsulfatase A-like enzyme
MKPNILFLLIDAFPSERCFGKEKSSLTPNIDYLIKNGVSFTQTISSADATPASLGSMFTGIFPFKNSVRGGLWFYKLKSNVTNFFNIFRKNGYHEYSTIPELTSLKEMFESLENEHFPIYGERLYDGVGEKIIGKLKKNIMKEPWFYFIHLMDVHKPISYPKKFNDIKYGLDEYDKAVSALDEWIGKIFKSIDLENTLIVLTADHGDYIRSVKNGKTRLSFEYASFSGSALKISKLVPLFLYSIKVKSFLLIRNIMTKIKLMGLGRKLTSYEKRNLDNARSIPNHFLFDELMKVPLIFHGPKIPKNIEVKQQVRTIDIFPTICDIINISNQNIIDGVSLFPLMNGEKYEELPAYMETSMNVNNFEEGGFGIRTSKYKYFRSASENEKKDHLYDLKKDPREEKNIANTDSKIVKEMEMMITKMKYESNNERDHLMEKIKKNINKLKLKD